MGLRTMGKQDFALAEQKIAEYLKNEDAVKKMVGGFNEVHKFVDSDTRKKLSSKVKDNEIEYEKAVVEWVQNRRKELNSTLPSLANEVKSALSVMSPSTAAKVKNSERFLSNE